MRTGITTLEMFLAQKTAANYGRTTAVHARYLAYGVVTFSSNAWMLEAPLLYQHNVDYGWWEIEEKLAVARERGLNM